MAMKGRVAMGRRGQVQDEINRLKAQVKAIDKKSAGSFVQQAIGAVSKVSKIALLAFNAHIAAELNERIKLARQLIAGTEEQEAVWREVLYGDKHVMVNAVAGSGKTFTLVQLCLRLQEMYPGATVEAMTYHSLGNRALYKAYGNTRLDKWKTYAILDAMKLPVAEHLEKMFKVRVNKLVSLVKNYGREDRKSLEWMIERHDLELNGMEEDVLGMVPKVLERCKRETATKDFDDMVWMPYAMGLDVPKFDIVMSDESQDLNVIQQYLAMKAGSRHVVVGDTNQAIYGFRGADSSSMDTLKKRLGEDSRGVVELPLTLTRRCPKSHVRMAQAIVPRIRAMDDAPEGKVSVVENIPEAVKLMKPGDMVLCRVNAELMKVAYALLKQGTKAIVRGRDIGEGIVKLIEKAELSLGGVGQMVPDMVRAAGEITGQESAKYMAMPNGRGEMRASAVADKYDCLVSLCDGCRDSIEVKRRIGNLFADMDDKGQVKHAVVLSSVHRGKGLEAGRVFILRPDILPHPMAKQEHEVQQEYNLMYVAVTRGKFERTSKVFGSDVTVDQPGELIFVGGVPAAFGGLPCQHEDFDDTLSGPKCRNCGMEGTVQS